MHKQVFYVTYADSRIGQETATTMSPVYPRGVTTTILYASGLMLRCSVSLYVRRMTVSAVRMIVCIWFGVATPMLMLMCVACYVMDMCVWYWYTVRTQSDRQQKKFKCSGICCSCNCRSLVECCRCY